MKNLDEEIVFYVQNLKIDEKYPKLISKPFNFFETGGNLIFFKLLNIFSIYDIKKILIGLVIVHYIKYVIKRSRPFQKNQLIKKKGKNKKLDPYSFPSGHSFSSFLYSLILYNKFNSPLVFVIPIMVGFSRMALGVHYPSDVLSGFALAYYFNYFYDMIK